MGMETHVINNERVNSTRSWVQSNYRQHISDDVLKATLTVLLGKDNRPPNYFEHELKHFLKKERRLTNIFKVDDDMICE